GDDRPRLAFGAPHGRVEHVRVAGLELDIHGAGGIGQVEHALPAQAAIARAVHAALCVGAERIADGGDVRDVRIGGMHAHPADVADLTESGVHPGLSRVDRLPHALADGDVGAVAVGSGAHVDGVGIGVGHVHVA